MRETNLNPKRFREMVERLIAAIDEGTVSTDSPEFELDMVTLGSMALDMGLRDLVPKIAMRTKEGRAVMKQRGMLH